MPNDVVDESGLLGQFALAAALSSLVALDFGDFVALVGTDNHLMFRSHGVYLKCHMLQS